MKSLKLTPLAEPVRATVEIPGSKSYTNRALLMAAMAHKPVAILKPLMSDDTKAMLHCLGVLGITTELSERGVRVTASLNTIAHRNYNLDANLSGTTIRFILALSCVVPGIKTIYGKEGLHKRPIADLVDALRQLGATIEYLDKEGFPPIRVSSFKLSSGTVRMNGGVSSQFLSALLMIAPLIGELNIEVTGEQISKPYIDMTIDMMRRWGVQVSNEQYAKYSVAPNQPYGLSEYSVEGDVSSASYFAAIAALTRSHITLTNMNPQSVQADMKFFRILEDMESVVRYEKDSIVVEGGGVRPLAVDMEQCPDQAQTVAVLAAFAKGKTTISGVRSLRVKETERVIALEQELAKMGIKTESTHDSLSVYGGNPKPATIDTYGDHRMAMSFAVAGTMLSGVEINDPDVVNKTFPLFWEKLASIGVGVKQV
jgi:3-phosphoshikimate 1-carboxyvinyltransferase